MPMPLDEQIAMLNAVEREIVDLRRANEELAPKAEAYDLLKKVVDMIPGPSRGYGGDVLYQLRKRRDTLRSEQELLNRVKTGGPAALDPENGEQPNV